MNEKSWSEAYGNRPVAMWQYTSIDADDLSKPKRIDTTPDYIRAKNAERARLEREERQIQEERGPTLKTGSRDSIHAVIARHERESYKKSHDGIESRVHTQSVCRHFNKGFHTPPPMKGLR